MADRGQIWRGGWWAGGFAPDPARAGQWYLGELGAFAEVWPDYQGAGIRVLVMGAGGSPVDADVVPNLQGGGDFVLNGRRFGSDTAPADAAQAAGMIAAVAGNGMGGQGIAPRARVATFDLPAAISHYAPLPADRVVEAAYSWAARFDVVLDLTPPLDDATLSGMAQLATLGRGGRGTLIVTPAPQAGAPIAPQTITAGVADRDGLAMAEGPVGSGLLVSGFDAADATGLAPRAAAAAQVAGLAALILDANPRLGWRDVQEILAITARQTGSALGAWPSGHEAGPWQITAADANGGLGLHYSESYGFGLIDARAAIRLALSYATLRQTAQTSANELTVSHAQSAPQAIEDAEFSPQTGQTTIGVTEVAFRVTTEMRLDSAVVTLSLSHSYADDLRLFLVAPDGTRFTLLAPDGQGDLMAGGWDGSFRVAGVLGLAAAGEWTIRIEDWSPMDRGQITHAQIDFYGRAAGGPQVFTDAAFDLIAAGGQVPILAPYAGQVLNLAALSSAVTVQAGAGGQIAAGGQVLAQIAGDYATYHLTDGHDRFTAGTAAAIIHGAQGRDTLAGGAGADTLYGGDGADHLSGGDGADHLHGGTGGDVVAGDAGNDQIFGDAGDDLVQGGAGDDRLWGGDGRDTLWGGAGADTLGGGAGADVFLFAAGSGTDRVVNISAAAGDWLYLDAGLFGPARDWVQVQADVQQVAGGFAYDFGGGDVLIVSGAITPAELAARVVIGDWA